jgi:flavin-dependent thymidylate synthase
MQVSLINFTGQGTPDPARHAANILLFTKNTRLQMTPNGMDDIATRDDRTVLHELEYMTRTIPSSWEFVDYTFLFCDVTRAFTHQLVRTRTGSYAQQTMRVLNKKGFQVYPGPTIQEDEKRMQRYNAACDAIQAAYDELIDDGAAIEDARGLLPTNILTNIVAKFSLRTVCELLRKRVSGRVQEEYRRMMAGMREECLRVHPFASMFFDRTFDKASHELEAMVKLLPIPPDKRTDMVKLIDQMRQS